MRFTVLVFVAVISALTSRAQDPRVWNPADRVSVVGEVARPGAYPVDPNHPLTILAAISEAKGLSQRSAARDSYIVRTDKEGVRHEVPVRLDEILRRLRRDMMLQPGDILVVPAASKSRDPLHVDPPGSSGDRSS